MNTPGIIGSNFRHLSRSRLATHSNVHRDQRPRQTSRPYRPRIPDQRGLPARLMLGSLRALPLEARESDRDSLSPPAEPRQGSPFQHRAAPILESQPRRSAARRSAAWRWIVGRILSKRALLRKLDPSNSPLSKLRQGSPSHRYMPRFLAQCRAYFGFLNPDSPMICVAILG